MMTRKITIMALIVGVILGAAATEGFNVYRQSQDSYRQSHDSRIFQERLRCKVAADAYVKEKTTIKEDSPVGVSLELDKVDYSPARNSCVAEVEMTNYFRGGALVFESVEDLVSGETLFSTKCAEDCDYLRLFFLKNVFDYVMNNASEPTELEKEWALMESKHPPKSALQIDPATGERVPKSPPELASPSGR